MTETVRNFGLDVQFTPDLIVRPSTEDEVLNALRQHAGKQVRVVGSGHAWNAGIQTDELLLDLQSLSHVELIHQGGEAYVRVGAGCRIRRLLNELNRHGLTLPAVGLITAQTVAGATATGTHGSGKHSLSHYVSSVRIACGPSQDPVIREVDGGLELQAARCSMGCLGVVVELTLPVVPQYSVTEHAVRCENFTAALEMESSSPTQQLYALPHSWSWYSMQRSTEKGIRKAGGTWLYRMYWFLGLMVGFTGLIKIACAVVRVRWLTRFLHRRIAPLFLFTGWQVTDRSDRILTMEHELFRHVEIELFVRRSHAPEALALIEDVLRAADSSKHDVNSETRQRLRDHNLEERFEETRGTFTHDSPLCVRRVLPDDTLISMSAGTEDWYSISLITYAKDREGFFGLARLFAEWFFCLYEARIHWGKWFPLSHEIVSQQYPRLPEFREIAKEFDPDGRFRNDFVSEKLGLRSKRGRKSLSDIGNFSSRGVVTEKDSRPP